MRIRNEITVKELVVKDLNGNPRYPYFEASWYDPIDRTTRKIVRGTEADAIKALKRRVYVDYVPVDRSKPWWRFW